MSTAYKVIVNGQQQLTVDSSQGTLLEAMEAAGLEPTITVAMVLRRLSSATSTRRYHLHQRATGFRATRRLLALLLRCSLGS